MPSPPRLAAVGCQPRQGRRLLWTTSGIICANSSSRLHLAVWEKRLVRAPASGDRPDGAGHRGGPGLHGVAGLAKQRPLDRALQRAARSGQPRPHRPGCRHQAAGPAGLSMERNTNSARPAEILMPTAGASMASSWKFRRPAFRWASWTISCAPSWATTSMSRARMVHTHRIGKFGADGARRRRRRQQRGRPGS